jgi:hypothetical protein
MAKWDMEDMESEVSDDPLISLDPDDNPPVHHCHSLNATTSDTTPSLDPIDNPTLPVVHQIFPTRDRPAPVRHPPLYFKCSPSPRYRPTRLTRPTSSPSQTAHPHHAVKHRARLLKNKSIETDNIPHSGPPTSQAKDPPLPLNLSSLYHVPSHLLQPTLDDALKLVNHLSRRVSAERRIQKRTRTTSG